MIKQWTLGLYLAATVLLNAGAAAVNELRCESRQNPLGLDETHPQLSWVIESNQRNEIQTAYQVLVASTAELLAADKADLWDSGKVQSSETAQIPYAGQRLLSQQKCFWKVRVWDRLGNPSTWSAPAEWSMGLLKPTDWSARWISDSTLADPANRPLTPVHCYRSELASSPDVNKCIVLDLGFTKHMDAIDIIPARPRGQNSDFRTAMFPVRFKVEIANQPDFSDARLVVDKTDSDFVNPRQNSCRFDFAATEARYVRLTVTRLSRWDGSDYGLALGGLAVFNDGQSIAGGVHVECSDSIESPQWSKRFLVDGEAAVVIAAEATVLAANLTNTPAKLQSSRVPMLRREFVLPENIRRATLHVAARGFYEMHLNGQRVGDELLAPGYTDYNVRIQYQTHDVTDRLRSGTNVIGALLGYGWYAGHMNLFEMRCIYGYFPQLLAQLDVELVDGSHTIINTDEQWRSTLDGPVRWSDLLDGEGYDCRREMSGWDQPGFDDSAWKKAWSQSRDETKLVWQRSQPVRAVGELSPVTVKEISSGVYVFDFGQEITGWCRLKVAGVAGTHLRLRHAELVTPAGRLNTENLWGTPQQEDYILDGNGLRTLEPHFTYHGFRYVELSGFTGELKPDTLVAINLHTDAPVASHFECSNELYNRIQKAAFWTQANLLFDVPAGCAARAERLAWTGDIRPCVTALLFNFDTVALLEKYAGDLRDDQMSDGRFTDICPHAHLAGTTTCVGSPGWADAGVSLPWETYVSTGDRRLLAEHFAAAQRWVDIIAASNPDFLWKNNRGMDWGDWMSAEAATPKEIGATAFFAHSADLVSRMAKALGREAEAQQYQTLFQNIRSAFVKNYVRPNGIIGNSPMGKPMMREVTERVRALIKNGQLTFLVKNETLGGDPALNRHKNLHLITRDEIGLHEQIIAEDHPVQLTSTNGKALEILSATYGYDGMDLDDPQGSYALALQFGLLDEPLRSLAAKHLDQLAIANGHHPTTGFWSSVELLLSLSSQGYNAEAARILNQRDEPSWGYMAENSTTFWEAFDANTRNLSLNHWTHSAVTEWFWRNVVGLNPDEQFPGYQKFTIHPRPTPEVSWCNADYQSVRGKIIIRWQCTGDQFHLQATIPANTTATVIIPAANADAVTESDKPIASAAGVVFVRADSGEAVYQVGSGTYQFRSRTSRNLKANFRP